MILNPSESSPSPGIVFASCEFVRTSRQVGHVYEELVERVYRPIGYCILYSPKDMQDNGMQELSR